MLAAFSRFCILVVLAACCFAFAADCEPSTLLLNVFNHNGEIAQDLKATDLTIEANGKTVPINLMVVDRTPRRIVLMLDTSGSMSADSKRNPWGITLEAAAFAVDTIPGNSSAAMETFSRELRRESPGFESREAVGARVLGLHDRSPYGPTSLYHSIQQTLDEFAELRFGDAIYLITDGGNNEGKGTRTEATRKLNARGIRIFIFLVVGNRNFHTQEEQGAVSEMEEMAESTGGALIKISSAQLASSQREPLNKLSRQISNQTAEFYRLNVGIDPLEKPAHIKVKLVDRDHSKTVEKMAFMHKIESCPH